MVKQGLGKARELELNTRVSALEHQIEENKQRETQLRLANKVGSLRF